MTERRSALGLALLLLLAACDEPCGGCPSGQVCVGGACETLEMCSPACTGDLVCLDGVCRKAALGEPCELNADCEDDPVPASCAKPLAGGEGGVCSRACLRHTDCLGLPVPSCCACSDENIRVCVPESWGECPIPPAPDATECGHIRDGCQVWTKRCQADLECALFEQGFCGGVEGKPYDLCWPGDDACGRPCPDDGVPGCP